MKKRCIALALALLLCLALPASAGGKLPDCFDAEELLSIYNDQLVKSFMAIKPTETATKVNLYRTFGLTPEGNVYWFNNNDGKVRLRVTFPQAQADLSGPAVELGFIVASSVDPLDYPTLKTVFANVIARMDSGADLQALLDWMAAAGKGGETLALNGYTLVHTRDSAGNTFTLVPDDADAGDTGPEIGPDSGPDILPEPDLRPESGPDILPEPEPAPEPTAEAEPEPEPTGTPRAAAGTLLSWKGFEVTPLRTERWLFASGQPSLRLYLHVVNQTGSTLSMRVEDMKVDGVALPATSIYNIQTGTVISDNTEASILVFPDDFSDNVVQSVLYGKNMTMKLLLQDAESYDDVYMERVSLDLGALPDKTTVMEPSNDPTPTPAATRKPSPTKAPTAKSSYKALFEGDKGEDVRRMQRKLIELGYLNDTADGQFGPKTATAVREFSETNGLGSYSYASSAMLEKLYSGSAKPFQEPWVPLIFEDNARGQWQYEKGDKLSFRAKVTNCSRTHTIRAFEFYMYATDVWGDKVYGDTCYYGTTTKTVKPGQSAFSDYFVLPNRSSIARVWCGVKKVIFSDGTIRENSTVNYDYWTIK